MILLSELQSCMQTHLLNDNLEIAQHVIKPPNDTSEARLAIYNDGYYARLLEALSKEYAVLYQWLGEESFFELGYAYIADYPSRYYSVDQFVQHLSEFLTKTIPYAQQPYLGELAHFIRALSNTITAEDAAVIEVHDITAIPQDAWSNMCLKLHPSVQLVTYQWNVVAIWQALSSQQALPAVSLQATPDHVVVWRKGIQSFYALLNANEKIMLQALLRHATFAEICDELANLLPAEEAAQQAVNNLVRWLNEGLLSEVSL